MDQGISWEKKDSFSCSRHISYPEVKLEAITDKSGQAKVHKTEKLTWAGAIKVEQVEGIGAENRGKIIPSRVLKDLIADSETKFFPGSEKGSQSYSWGSGLDDFKAHQISDPFFLTSTCKIDCRNLNYTLCYVSSSLCVLQLYGLKVEFTALHTWKKDHGLDRQSYFYWGSFKDCKSFFCKGSTKDRWSKF